MLKEKYQKGLYKTLTVPSPTLSRTVGGLSLHPAWHCVFVLCPSRVFCIYTLLNLSVTFIHLGEPVQIICQVYIVFVLPEINSVYIADGIVHSHNDVKPLKRTVLLMKPSTTLC